MDYNISQEDKICLIEMQKNRVKNQIIEQYIEIRKKKGLSQENIADMTGIARTNVIRIESRRNVPTIEVLTKLAEAIDMELEVRFVEKNRG